MSKMSQRFHRELPYSLPLAPLLLVDILYYSCTVYVTIKGLILIPYFLLIFNLTWISVIGKTLL